MTQEKILERLQRLVELGSDLDDLREQYPTLDIFMDIYGSLRLPCSPGCRGYDAFDAGRAPDPALRYSEELEIQRCDECCRYPHDLAAARAWKAAGKPALITAGSAEPVQEKTIQCPKCKKFSGDDWSQCKGVCPMSDSPHFALDRLLREVVALARAKGWSIEKLQDEVFAYFDSTEGKS